MARVYALGSDYDNEAEVSWEGTPELLLKRLRRASEEVDSLVLYARYSTDEDGFPTDPDVSEAFTRATCAIVEHWEETGDPSGVEASAGTVSIGSVSLGGGQASSETSEDKLSRRIGSRAALILRNARLISFPGY